MTCGYYLSKLGFKVILLDKGFVGHSVSSNTTGKITYQHNLIYDYLIRSYGEKFAKAYLNANKEAILNIKKIIDTENIDCDFEFLSNYIYTTNQNDLPKLHAEIKALNLLGETPTFLTSSPLPFKIAGAIQTPNQAQFNPVKYMNGLSKSILKNNGSLIFQNSTVSDFKKVENNYITYSNGFEVKSSKLIVTTHYPFKKFSRILFF